MANIIEPHEQHNVVILGAGVAGLAAASVLGKHAVVVEKESRPGGLVRTHCFDGYWFDRVIHLLYFGDDLATRTRIQGIVGDALVACPPLAFVESQSGVTRYPIQMNIGGLPEDVRDRCLSGLEEAVSSLPAKPVDNFRSLLLATFGSQLCEEFLFPYNEKMWKRDLTTLAPTGFDWNITQPDMQEVRKGAASAVGEFKAYNASGWYPRPPADSPVRGMEVLSQSLAASVQDLRLQSTVRQIDLENKRVLVQDANGEYWIGYRHKCVSTLPLPVTTQLCQGAPENLATATNQLRSNRVISAAVRIKGPRPNARGHWRYYSDSTLIFTRLVYMHEFDPLSAPKEGWGLLVEITQRSEDQPLTRANLLKKIKEDLIRAGTIPNNCKVIGIDLMEVDPAYVTFTPESRPVVKDATAFLESSSLLTLGRYGRWEYSSMAQVMRDGFALGETLARKFSDA